MPFWVPIRIVKYWITAIIRFINIKNEQLAQTILSNLHTKTLGAAIDQASEGTKNLGHSAGNILMKSGEVAGAHPKTSLTKVTKHTV